MGRYFEHRSHRYCRGQHTGMTQDPARDAAISGPTAVTLKIRTARCTRQDDAVRPASPLQFQQPAVDDDVPG